MRRLLALSILFLVAGCSDNPVVPGTRDDLFSVREVKLHPVFTRINDWTGDGRADGIDALVELHDQFGDTTKGAGTFTFELFEYRRDQPDPRGRRLSNPWVSDVISADQQAARWSKTSRCYVFRLQSDVVSKGTFVFAVTYTPTSGPRAFDKVVLTNRLAPISDDDPNKAPLLLPPTESDLPADKHVDGTLSSSPGNRTNGR